ncbi:NAD(P)-dependent dehydrogenase (short-subunit alcohol dehydrogenase family) [Paenibacillus forsythiae]|uniref:NAD(P)-dependent dehydrogenase (Short-subunit alcohol dehydrogenase family) n=1 Tax=Paenibacillus forsythiae TaxID=365616 RepID=A0ABU3H3L9_9BACL|nr:SDR family oxidoreductase [Paenibacillus forsythiae]MDT3425056.1 NAD(P)-dependent dehydrogenase (short-subunit alcohol dehydrogenase family) [Paenibacillus forsythiae]
MNPQIPYFGSEVQCRQVPLTFPPQRQYRQPGLEFLMVPRPIYDNPNYKGSGKLLGKTALISGGDSGIGRAVAVAFAKEGADVTIAYLCEHQDAVETRDAVTRLGRRCLLIPGDLRRKEACKQAVRMTLECFGQLDILVNNSGVQFVRDNYLDITEEQLRMTFDTNIISFFHMTTAALPHMPAGSSIVNTASVNAYIGRDNLIDYSSTKGAIVSFTRALANNLADKGIRVNAVAPGPFWTPLNVATQPPEAVNTLGADTPMKRAGQPYELAPVYVLLASDDGSYITGQTIHVNGGQMTTS